MLPLSPTGLESDGDEIFTMTSKDGDFTVTKSASQTVEPAKFPKVCLSVYVIVCGVNVCMSPSMQVHKCKSVAQKKNA